MVNKSNAGSEDDIVQVTISFIMIIILVVITASFNINIKTIIRNKIVHWNSSMNDEDF